jgi:2'-5' RNA ligase
VYTFHVTFDDEESVQGIAEVRRVVDEYQTALAGVATLDPIPFEWLHLTMQGVGFTDEVSDADLTRILEAARRRCAGIDRMRLTLNRCLVTAEGVLLNTRPAEPLRRLRDAVRQAIGDVWGEDRIPERPGFHPHVTVAYSNAPAAGGPLAEIVDEAEIEPATFEVRAASLIALNRDERMYKWVRRGPVRLGAG